ncbi:MAG: hypothetical protein RBS48_08780 [Ignavibacteriaceae bacterium]|jgi:exo-1,4-beta-D-glucosaminidase|nr:hypothetical protein [Ignavibacteriaceae bacterium]
MNKIFSKSSKHNVAKDFVSDLENISIPEKDKEIYFLDLRVRASERILSRNFYVLSEIDDILDKEKTDWTRAPTLKFSNLKALNNMETVKLSAELSSEKNHNVIKYRIKLSNNNDRLAFQINIKAFSENGELIAPIFMDDNYFSLIPNEEREIELKIPIDNNSQKVSDIKISGWNIEEIVLRNE